jgi:hypothetical protein
LDLRTRARAREVRERSVRTITGAHARGALIHVDGLQQLSAREDDGVVLRVPSQPRACRRCRRTWFSGLPSPSSGLPGSRIRNTYAAPSADRSQTKGAHLVNHPVDAAHEHREVLGVVALLLTLVTTAK